MPVDNIIRFLITPQTWVRRTEADAILFKIPEHCPKKCGLPRRNGKAPLIEVPDPKKPGKMKQVRYGCPHCLSQESLDRKNKLERYTNYKRALNALALSKKFQLPYCGFSLYFFVPIPPSTKSKKKRARMHGTLHHVRPDWDNFSKAFIDSIRKEDSDIAQLSGVGKFWVDVEPDKGWIEVHLNQPLYDPFDKLQKASELVFHKPALAKRRRELISEENVVYAKPDQNAYDAPKSSAAILDEMSQLESVGKKWNGSVSANDVAAMDEIKRLSKKRNKK